VSDVRPLRIVVCGLIAQHPRLGGMTWHHAQYAGGLARLGHEVYYLEDSGEWPYNHDGGDTGEDWVARDPRGNVAHLREVMERFGLGDRWGYRFPIEPRWYGMSDRRREQAIATADLLINVSGSLEDPARYHRIPRLAYVDSDPVFTQIELALGENPKLARRVAGHDVHFSFGARLDHLPSSGYRWCSTRQPLLLDEWSPLESHRGAFTTVMSWTSYRSTTFESERYGQKDIEFLRFLDLPARHPQARFEVALPTVQHLDWEAPEVEPPAALRPRLAHRKRWAAHELLAETGWRAVDALEACGSMDRYRDYIRDSRAEWTVAKNGYVRGNAGWFSERSACYLAAGRPVVTQDTGLAGVLPVGEGLLTFSTPREAAAAVTAVQRDWKRHARAAREIAESHFAADQVLGRLVDEALAAPSRSARARRAEERSPSAV
jgi:hypothetical protein